MRKNSLRAGALTAAAALAMPLAMATPAAAVEGEFSGNVGSELLFLDALNLSALAGDAPSVAKLGVAPTVAQANHPGGIDGASTRGYGANLDVSLLDQALPLELTEAEQTAPPDNTEPTTTQLIPLDALSPLLTGSVSESSALARDPEVVECPDSGREPVSLGRSTTTDLGVLAIPDVGSLISVVGEDEGTLTALSGMYVGSGGEVIGEASAQGAEVNIADQLRIEVSNPVLTATATGQPGGASIEYTGEVRVNGDKIAGTQENTISLDVLDDLLIPLDELVLNEVFGPVDEVLAQLTGPIEDSGIPLIDDLSETLLTDLINDGDIDLDALLGLSPTVRITAGVIENPIESADGTVASGSVSAVSIELTLVSTLVGTEVPILSFDLAPMSASAVAPVGGLDCGGGPDDPDIEVIKDVSSARVRPGNTFDYAINVGNRGVCPLEDVVVTDLVTGPAGFTIESVSPSDGTVNGGTVTWDVGTLQPNETATFTITVRAPADAPVGQSFADDVDVTGIATGDCGDEPKSGGDDLTGPVVDTASLDGCDVSPSNKSASHIEVTPGQSFSYWIHVFNAGDEDCGEVTVTDTLPAGTEYVGCQPAICSASGQEVTAVIDSLGAGEARTIVITVTAPDAVGQIDDNVAIINPANGDGVEVDSPSPEVTDESIPNAPDPADFDGGGPGDPGQPPVSMPRTGGGLAALAIASLAGAGALRRRRF